jgi:hypothetical protein
MTVADRIASLLVTDRALRIAGYATAVVAVFTVVLGGFYLNSISSDTTASRRTDDLASCRAQFRSDIDDATVHLFDTYGDVQTGISRAVVASIRQDPTTLALIAADLELAERAKDEAVVALIEASDRYEAAVDLSRLDPSAFLSQCQENQ